MKIAAAIIIASALTALAAGETRAGEAERRSLYSSATVLTFFTDDMKAELKITPDQERGLKANDGQREKIWHRHVQELAKVTQAKLPERDKDAKRRALETQVVDELFQLYGETLRPEQIKRMKQIILQVRGMEIFDFPEIRKALKIGDKEVKGLRAAYDKLARELTAELRAQVKAKKITEREAAKKATTMTFSVPEEVRESLNTEQKRVLNNLLGERYNYN